MPESPSRGPPARNNLGAFFRNLGGGRSRTNSNYGVTLSGSSSAVSTPAARLESATNKLSHLLATRSSFDAEESAFKPTSPTNTVVESLLHSLESEKEVLWAKRVGQALRTDAQADVAAVWQKCEVLLDPKRSLEVRTAGVELLKTCVAITNEDTGGLRYPYERQLYYNAVRRYASELKATQEGELQSLVAVLEFLTRGGRDFLGLDGIIPLLLDLAVELTLIRQRKRFRYVQNLANASTPLLDPTFSTPFIRLPPEFFHLTSDPKYSPAALLVSCHRFSFAQIPEQQHPETIHRFITTGLKSLGEHEIVKILEMIDTVVVCGYLPEVHLEDVVEFVARVTGLEGRCLIMDISPDGQSRTAVISDDLPMQAHAVMRHLLRSPANQALKHLRSVLSAGPAQQPANTPCPTPLLVGTLRCLRRAYSEFESSNGLVDAAERPSDYWPSLLHLGMYILRDNLLTSLEWRSEQVDSEILLFLEERLAAKAADKSGFIFEEWEMLISILERCTWHIAAWEAKHARPWVMGTAGRVNSRKIPTATSKAEAAPVSLTKSPFSPAEASASPPGVDVLTCFSLVISRMLAAQADPNFQGSHLRFFDFLLTIARYLNASTIISFFHFYQIRQLASPGREDWIPRLHNIVSVFFPADQYISLPESVRAGRSSAIKLLRGSFNAANGYAEYLGPLLDTVLYPFFSETLPLEEDAFIASSAFSLLDRIMQEAIRDFDRGERPRQRADRLLTILVNMSWQSPAAEPSILERAESRSMRPGQSPDRGTSRREVEQVDIGLSAAQSLIYAFYRCIVRSNRWTAAFGVRIFRHMLNLLSPTGRDSILGQASVKTRLAILQCLSRLRSDQRHRVWCRQNLDFESLAESVGRVQAVEAEAGSVQAGNPEHAPRAADREREGDRGRKPHTRERDPAQGTPMSGSSRGKTASRSRTRDTSNPPPRSRNTDAGKSARPLWSFPDILLHTFPDQPVQPVGAHGIVSFDHFRMRDWSETSADGGSDFSEVVDTNKPQLVVLPVSEYLETILACLQQETEWELVSYILCAFPNQLANKHFACGPRAAKQIQVIRQILCDQLNKDTLGQQVANIPGSVRRSDMHAVAYQWLATAIAYRDLFSREQQNEMVVTFMRGLSKTPNIAKPSIHAMTMACYEFESSMSKYLPEVLGALVRIISTVGLPVHILELVASIGHIKSLYANFTEDDYKKVFAVAVQYLSTHYEALLDDPSGAIVPEDITKATAHAFKQYVFLLSYYVIALWYTIIPVSDRPRYTGFIVQRLLRTNEGLVSRDSATEVSLDMLARLAYSNTTPFSTEQRRTSLSDSAFYSKTWIIGNSVLTLQGRNGERKGVVTIRRPSGFVKQQVHLDSPEAQTDDILRVLLSNRDVFQVPPSLQVESPMHDQASIFEADPAFFTLFLPPQSHINEHGLPISVKNHERVERSLLSLDRMPHIDFHKIGVIYVAEGQTREQEILQNMHGSKSYNSFLDGLGNLIRLKGSDSYAGGLDTEEDLNGKYTYVWSDQLQQVIFHIATLMPTRIETDPNCIAKKAPIGNDYVKIIYNDSGMRTPFDILPSQFNFVNIIVEPNTPAGEAWKGATGISNNTEFFRVSMQKRSDMPDIGPLGIFKMVSTASLPGVVRELALHANVFAQLYLQSVGLEGRSSTRQRMEYTSTWRNRLQTIQQFKQTVQKGQEEAVQQ